MQQSLAAAGPNPPQVRTELMTRTGPAATEIIDALDSFYCYNITAALWADAVINRLEGLAIFLLGDELAEAGGRARAAARRLADRIGDLGGAGGEAGHAVPIARPYAVHVGRDQRDLMRLVADEHNERVARRPCPGAGRQR
jgi:hypothetical protein